MGQHRGCPPALRLARTYAAQHHQLQYARCGYRIKAGAVARLSHPLQSVWISCAARGPPASPLPAATGHGIVKWITRHCR